MDSKLFSLHTIETFWNKIKDKFYVKPANGIPKSDLNTTVQSSLNKADSALQEHQDISGKQDKSTAVTHTANTAVGSATKPVYIDANGVATPISHSINADVPTNAKFTDTTYNDATQSAHGLMTAKDKKKLDGMDLSKYLHFNVKGDVVAGTWYKFASFTCTQQDNYSTAIFSAGLSYNDVLLFRVTVGNEKGVPAISRFSVSNITGDVTGKIGYVISGNTVDLFLKPNTRIYGYVERLAATARTGDYIQQTSLVAATSAESSTVVAFSNIVTDIRKATTLTDSGWVDCQLLATSGTAQPASTSTIRVRKYGKLVRLEAFVKYTTAFSTGHNIATIPEGYRPGYLQREHGITPTAAYSSFDALLTPDGILSYAPNASNSSSSTFNPANLYECRMTYFID